jgi:hypothetical protein
MTYPSEVTDLIRRYLWRVERRLPAAQAADVVKELDSLLRDQLDAKAEESQRSVDEAMTSEVLKALGSPEDVAARYTASPRFLIGPAAYPLFLKVAGWVLGGMGLVMLIQAFLRAIASQGQGLGLLLLSSLGHWFQASMFALAWVVLVFAVMERVQSKGWPPKLDWDPRELPELPEREEDKASAASMILELVGPVLTLVLLNYIPKEGWTFASGGTQIHIPHYATLGLNLPMLWINALLGMEILLALVVLEEGRWNPGLRWAKVFLELAGVAIMVWILRHLVVPSSQILATIHPAIQVPPQILEAIAANIHRFALLLPLLMLISPLQRAWGLVKEGLFPQRPGASSEM